MIYAGEMVVLVMWIVIVMVAVMVMVMVMIMHAFSLIMVVVGHNFANRRNLDIERPSYANLNRLIGQVNNDTRIFVTNKQSLYIDRDFLSLVMKGPSCPPGGLLHHHLPPLRRGAQRRPDRVPDQPGALPKVQASKKS